MSEDARNSLYAWGVVSLVAVLFVVGLWLFKAIDLDLPDWVVIVIAVMMVAEGLWTLVSWWRMRRAQVAARGVAPPGDRSGLSRLVP